jgi:hypothetical protein
MLDLMGCFRRAGVGTLLLAMYAGGVPQGDDLSRNNTIHFEGRGSGTCERGGQPVERLAEVTVDVDRGGRILVSFQTGKGRPPLTFSGAVIGVTPAAIKADVASDDPARLRGSMYLARNAHGEISRISLEATNGQQHLRLEWNRRR